jgi:PIN domain nuclease of toxin-antitoxin system
VKFLLDTHTAVWVMASPGRIPPAIRRRLEDAANQVFLSVVSLVEIAAKQTANHRSAPALSAVRVLELATTADFEILPVLPPHALSVEGLRHGDPFDRLLVAQAQVENLRFVTHDEKLVAYGETILFY